MLAWLVEGWSGTMPPAWTKTGIRLVGTLSVCVDGPVNVAPVNQSTHVPGGNHTEVVAVAPGVVTGATSMLGPSMYSVGLVYAAACVG